MARAAAQGAAERRLALPPAFLLAAAGAADLRGAHLLLSGSARGAPPAAPACRQQPTRSKQLRPQTQYGCTIHA